MATGYRTCGGVNQFNSGISRCPVPRGKIKGVILVSHGYSLPSELTADNIMKAIHADRPNRIFPIKTVDEFAPSGGEAETSQQGYGANKVSGISARTDAFTLDKYDAGLRANVVEAKNNQFDVYLINNDGYIFGQTGDNGEFKGIPLSGIYVGGQDFDSSGQVANFVLNLMYSDIEEHFKLEDARKVEFNILSLLSGLVEVEWLKMTAANTYKLIESYGRLDITEYYGALIKAGGNTVIANATSSTNITYADGILTIPTVNAAAPVLAKPSVLFGKGITGIEQVGTVSGSAGGSGDDEVDTGA